VRAGTKFFFHERTRGPNFIQHFMAAATPHNASAAAPVDGQGVGLYLEAQTGVAPSQRSVRLGFENHLQHVEQLAAKMRQSQSLLSFVWLFAYVLADGAPLPLCSHVFPLPRNSSVEWTEWFRVFSADEKALHADDYGTALETVEGWLDSPDGMDPKHLVEMERFFDAHSADPVTPSQVLSHGLPWGGLRQALKKQQRQTQPLAPGVWFPDVTDPAWLATTALAVQAAVGPWTELLTDGAFSSRTLERLPGAFEVAPEWYSRLEASAAAAGGGDGKWGGSWLHGLLMGTIELERGWPAQVRMAPSFSRRGQLQPFIAVFAQECQGQLAYFGPT
jgi:hypothetical protein